MQNSYKWIRDFCFNTIASFLPIVTLQMIILPLLSRNMDGEYYGWMILMISILTLVSSGLGSVLNNVHLLLADYYRDKEYGDFGYLFIILSIINVIVVGIFFCYYSSTNWSVIDFILILIAGEVTFARCYYGVRLYIELDYWGLLKNSIALVGGYIFGAILSLTLSWNWECIYIFGALFSLIFLIKKYPIHKNLFHKTKLLPLAGKKTCIFSIATLLNRALQYVDRLLLFPLMGGMETTIYYVSSLIGKLIAMAMTPINSFILSKVARKNQLRKKVFLKTVLISIITAIISYMLCVLAAHPLLKILYPQWVDLSMQYVYVLTLSSVISAISLVISPMILKFCNPNWQIAIHAVCLAVYIIVSLILLKYKGLIGFCYSSVIVNTVSVVMNIIIYLLAYNEHLDDKEEDANVRN